MTNEEQLRVTALYHYPEHSLAYGYLSQFTYPHEALAGLADFIRALGATLPEETYTRVGEDVWVAKSASVAPTASLTGPLIVGERAQVRHCAFVRGSAIVGADAVVGNSTELKNCILFDGVQVPHYNYVGDAVLGYRAHLGAGVVLSNVKGDKQPVVIHAGEFTLATGRKKVGAMLGDFAEIGCNSVLNPGTVIGRHATVYPLSSVRGLVPERHIFKAAGRIVPKKEV